MDALTSLKAAFDRLLKGEKVVQNGEIVWDDFFGRRAGISFLEDLEKKFSGVKINRDSRRRTLALFGAPEKRAAVRSAILGLVSQQQEQKIRAFPVDGRFIGVFMSADLVKLQQELGHENVWFDLTNHMLKVRGDKDAHKVAQLAVVHARSQRIAPRRRGEVECPVCFGEVTHPVTLKCGHSWCKACLTRYLVVSADTKVFPLTCLGNEATCSHAIPLATAQELLTTNEFESIIHASFLSYIQSRPSEFHYCPTPDCNQIYRTATPEKVIHCPSCLIRICPTCHTEYHDGAECVDKEAEDDKLFEEWKNAHDVKDCPSCKVPIERIAGCNHMACISCKTHICWACLATFTRSDEVYEHMRATHGGIGLGLD
ncbi:hypothetical protein A0H81_02434 [Grifola frondosa]|uniref:RING-type domain-containing protein n=1 Tax=Grifola frondosa TaxID=5627 RepID=A0A1C7MLJ0_GRIFR|nr:hypothetical protein A0H81_02434 [Grifola frondosa]